MSVAQPAAAEKGHSPKLDKALAKVADQSGDTTRVIIRVREGQLKEVIAALRKLNVRVKHYHRLISALTADVPTDALDALADLDAIESISIDGPTT